MRTIIILTAAVLLFGCGNAPEVKEEPVTNTRNQSDRVADTVASHTVEGDRDKKNRPDIAVPPAPNEGAKRKWSRSGDPIDTSKFDAAIESAAADLKANPSDAALQKALGTAYFRRGVALTAARQYASAIGDFRKAVKNDPANSEAKQQIAVITSIYDSMNIESPKEGEEPPPLEFE
ncbi:MAG: hypothetical protein OEM82_05215 [Acidobacteriota bacterium]|nr:hypothetical protein [Acidobacteriota bacterium]